MKNNYRIENDVVFVEVVSKGVTREVLIDVEDLPLIGNKKVCLSNGYASIWLDGKNRNLHKLITGTGKAEVIDHENGNRLDNRKANLIVGDYKNNSRNKNNKYKRELPRGVYWKQSHNAYEVKITVDNKTKYIGITKDLQLATEMAEEAMEVYWK